MRWGYIGLWGWVLAVAGCSVVPTSPGFPEVDNFQQARGQRLFVENCERCHPGGELGIGPSLLRPHHSATVIRAQVRLGLGIMPSFPARSLSAEELDAVVAYVHFLEERQRVEDRGPP